MVAGFNYGLRRSLIKLKARSEWRNCFELVLSYPENDPRTCRPDGMTNILILLKCLAEFVV
jgi:hypothetical protein